MKKSKYVGMIFEGRWKVIGICYPYNYSPNKGKYILENIYNGNKITIQSATIKSINEGKTTVSRTIIHNKKWGFKGEQ